MWKTTHAGHAREMARDNDLSGFDALCIIGGDGSIHELVNGILARADDMYVHTLRYCVACVCRIVYLYVRVQL